MQNKANATRSQEVPPPSRFVEALRRIFLLVGLFGALWTGFNYTPDLLSVRPVDFEHDKARKSEGVVGSHYAAMTLEAFVADRTKDCLVRVVGPEWKTFFDGVEAAREGRGGPEWDKRFGSGYAEDNLFFRPDDKPLHELAAKFTGEGGFTYVAMESDGKTEYLGVSHVHGTDIHVAPWAVSRPLRNWTVWFLVVGLVGYTILPWPRHPTNAIRYGLIRAAILPDLVGSLVAGTFFALPILVLSGGGGPDIGGGPLDFHTGAAYFTLVFWAIGAIPLAIPVVALWYSTFQLLVLPDSLRRHTLLGCQEISFSDIEEARLIVYRLPWWLRAFMMLSGKPHMMGLAMDVQSGIGLSLRNGTTWRLWLRGLMGEEWFVPRLRAAGVKVSPELNEFEGKRAAPPRESAGAAARAASRRLITQGVFVALILVLGAAFGTWLNAPPTPHKPPEPSGPLPDPAVMFERDQIIREMGDIINAHKAALERAQKGTPEERKAALKEAQELMEKFEGLQAREEALSKPKAQPKTKK